MELLHRYLTAAMAGESPIDSSCGEAAISAQAKVDADFTASQAGTFPDIHLRVWTNDTCVVASRAQSVSPHFESARCLSEKAGWPVVVRRSGGSAVVHRAGIVNVSLRRILSPESQSWMTEGYEELLVILVAALGRFGAPCDYGPVVGAYCNGRYNLRSGGRKLAGTAACSFTAGGSRYGVFHASITVTGSLEDDLHAVGRFERGLGLPVSYDPFTHVSLSELVAARRSRSSAASTNDLHMRRWQ
jgi:octanoyl-[GcvH]:protein N-octanoyltransferase